MAAVLLNLLKSVGRSLLISLLTETFIKELLVDILEWLAKKTDNEVDDNMVASVKRAIEKQDK